MAMARSGWVWLAAVAVAAMVAYDALSSFFLVPMPDSLGYVSATIINLWPLLRSLFGIALVAALIAAILLRPSEVNPGVWRMFGIILLIHLLFTMMGALAMSSIETSLPMYKSETLQWVNVYWFARMAIFAMAAVVLLVPFRRLKWLAAAGIALTLVLRFVPLFPPDHPDYLAQMEEYEPDVQRWQELYSDPNVPEFYTIEAGKASGEEAFRFRVAEDEDYALLFVKEGDYYARITRDVVANGGYTHSAMVGDWPVSLSYLIILAYLVVPKDSVPRIRWLEEADEI